ncbi:MAG: sigma-70 family RNA polymerase sigma factor [Flavobacteriaceae bacterium]|nr:sigma-70 family RNA polymerase sigma factor [Flavobacteriaceae bacterium]
MMTNHDQDIIIKIIDGDTNAFSVLVDRYKDLIFTLTLRMLKNREEAEEVAQDAFIKAFKSIDKYKGDSKFSTWLYRIAYNSSLDRIKKNTKFNNNVAIDEYSAHEVKTIENAYDALEQKERHETIKYCLNKLPSKDSFMLTLYYFDELSLEEISDVTGIKANNIKVKLFRARKKLATILKKELDNETIVSYGTTYRTAL